MRMSPELSIGYLLVSTYCTYITEFGKVSEYVEQDFLSNWRAECNITNLYVSYMVNSRHTGQHTTYIQEVDI